VEGQQRPDRGHGGPHEGQPSV